MSRGADIALVALFVALAVPVLKHSPPDDHVVHNDLVYARAGGKDLLLDLHLPEEFQGRLPVILWVHGGGWRAGNKRSSPPLWMVRHGYAVASINYRLSQEAIFPAQIQDCKAAVRWLRANSSKYQLDPNRIGAWGASAGGHLVALLGTSADVAELEAVPASQVHSSRVQAVVDYFGPTDFLKMSEFPGRINHDAPDSPESLLIGGPIQQNKDKAARANPITWAGAGDAPFLIVHGKEDPLVPVNQSELLAAALEKAGVPVKLHIVAGAGHGGREFRAPEVRRMVRSFFDQRLKQQ